MGILEIEDISISFEDKVILDKLSVDFWEGHIHAIVGPNGAGKSTLAQTIMGLPGFRKHEGEIRFQGHSIKRMSVDERAKQGITLAWQEPARFEGLSVRSFIKAASSDITEQAVDEALTMVGMDSTKYKGRSVDKTLSGGERKRIELASIIAMQPKVVMMDEPDSGVDIDAINNIFLVIRELKQRGTTVILITHSAEVLKQSDHAFLICDGKLVDKGRVESMLAYFEGKCKPCTHKNEPDVVDGFSIKENGIMESIS
ncbi:MAG: ABC transporter ATP-binding protein [Spirochaetales bacterium]|nr:ABC transporter ATP-binding protein [Spirochaetales bacterium]